MEVDLPKQGGATQLVPPARETADVVERLGLGLSDRRDPVDQAHGEGIIGVQQSTLPEVPTDNTLGYQAGKRVRKAFYGATRAAVAVKLTAALRDVQTNTPTSSCWHME